MYLWGHTRGRTSHNSQRIGAEVSILLKFGTIGSMNNLLIGRVVSYTRSGIYQLVDKPGDSGANDTLGSLASWLYPQSHEAISRGGIEHRIEK